MELTGGMLTDCFVLKGHEPVRCRDVVAWALWFETADRRVAETACGAYRVSTVFLGLNHQFGKGPPLLFETMVFEGERPLSMQRRYSTWDEAEKGHGTVVEFVRLNYKAAQC